MLSPSHIVRYKNLLAKSKKLICKNLKKSKSRLLQIKEKNG
jgi:hypothetical protein